MSTPYQAAPHPVPDDGDDEMGTAFEKVSDMMLGEGVLDATVNWIKGEALQINTEAGYASAAAQLDGINRLWLMFRQKQSGSTGLFESLALNNELGHMERLARSPEARARYGEVTKGLRNRRSSMEARV